MFFSVHSTPDHHTTLSQYPHSLYPFILIIVYDTTANTNDHYMRVCVLRGARRDTCTRYIRHAQNERARMQFI